MRMSKIWVFELDNHGSHEPSPEPECRGAPSLQGAARADMRPGTPGSRAEHLAARFRHRRPRRAAEPVRRRDGSSARPPADRGAPVPLVPTTTGRQVRSTTRCTTCWAQRQRRVQVCHEERGDVASLETMSCRYRYPGWPPGWTVPCRGCRGACHVRGPCEGLPVMTITKLRS